MWCDNDILRCGVIMIYEMVFEDLVQDVGKRK